jgi:hypothetical protein
MSYSIPQGVQVSLGLDSNGQTTTVPSNMVWYKLSDHNRQPIGVTYNLIESTDRMANGTLRKFIVARKFVIKVDWKDFPTLDSNLVDYASGSLGAAWLKAFYEGNSFNPIYVKLMYALDTPQANSIPVANSYVDSKSTTGQVYNAFMTTFSYDVTKRRAGYDYVNLTIEFTEI